jgi:menaquinone-dependent protoporphyrinogen oxidase
LKALVAFGTRYGSTARVAQEIASVLAARGLEVKVLDLRQDTEGVEGYDLVVAGSSIVMGSWSKEALRFLQSNRTVLVGRKIALFACCGDVMLNPGAVTEQRKRYLEDVADRFGIPKDSPLGLFGGELDFNKYGFLLKTFLNGQRRILEARGIDPGRPYDFRDWEVIRRWAGSLPEG